MRPNERITMSRISDVLDHAIAYLQHINELIESEQAAGHSERVQMLLNAYALEQRTLTGAIERYLEDAPDRVLGTYVNFTVELPSSIGGLASDSTLALTEWLVGVNQHLQALFSEVAGSVSAGEVRTAFEGLTSQIENHERKLSKEYQRFEDL